MGACKKLVMLDEEKLNELTELVKSQLVHPSKFQGDTLVTHRHHPFIGATGFPDLITVTFTFKKSDNNNEWILQSTTY